MAPKGKSPTRQTRHNADLQETAAGRGAGAQGTGSRGQKASKGGGKSASKGAARR